ncbi:hypothetical protein BH24ACT5_BH24ACT5_07070 [soil metagenome]
MPIAEIDIEDFVPVHSRSARVIDVRESDEYEDGHVPRALHIPLSRIPDRLDAFDGEGPTYVVCQSGGRSMRACEIASSQGRDVVNVTGGTGAWIRAGHDIVAGGSPS